jgi:hypothetical protein
MNIFYDHIQFDTGRIVHCKDEVFCLNENGFLRVLSHDSVVKNHTLSRNEYEELKQYYQDQILLINKLQEHDEPETDG